MFFIIVLGAFWRGGVFGAQVQLFAHSLVQIALRRLHAAVCVFTDSRVGVRRQRVIALLGMVQRSLGLVGGLHFLLQR